MASYAPLQTSEDHRYDDEEDGTKDPFLQEQLRDLNAIDSENPSSLNVSQSPSRLSRWATIGLSVVSILSAGALFIASTRVELPGPRSAQGLRQPDQYGTLDLVNELKGGPSVWFPRVIIRANKAAPDEVYTSNSHVVIDDDNSMFFQWVMPHSRFTYCYIGAAFPDTPEEGAAANKTYVSSGNLREFQVWNVTTPSEPLKNITWNTRPERVSLMGTVAFIPEKDMVDQLELEEGWQIYAPTPRFRCGQKETYTVEVTCQGCSLEYDQIRSLPPLAFDLFQII